MTPGEEWLLVLSVNWPHPPGLHLCLFCFGPLPLADPGLLAPQAWEIHYLSSFSIASEFSFVRKTGHVWGFSNLQFYHFSPVEWWKCCWFLILLAVTFCLSQTLIFTHTLNQQMSPETETAASPSADLWLILPFWNFDLSSIPCFCTFWCL